MTGKKLQGTVSDIKKTGEEHIDKEGNKWQKCIFTIKLTNFSKRSRGEEVPSKLKGKEIKIIRYCCFDWHYKLGARKTLDVDETEAVLNSKPTKTVYW